ncbi:hypothetical protein [Halapricum desulfuricans]|nr:hypothetical protein [Halapricum desulfuricans]
MRGVLHRSTPPEFAVAGVFAMVGIVGMAAFAVVLHLISLVYT